MTTRRVTFHREDENAGDSDTGATRSSSKNVIPLECDPILCPADIEARWFTPKELQDILLECKAIINNNNSHSNDSGYNCTVMPEVESNLRGLEMIIGGTVTPSWLQQRREWTRAVLQEQQRLREISQDGSVNPLALAEATKKICGHRQRVAHLRGLQDAQAVYGGDDCRGKKDSLFELAKHAELLQKKRTERRERRNRDNVALRTA